MSGGAALFADFRERIDRYREARDFPAVKGPSYLSVHLRFGTVSIRELAAYAHARSLEPAATAPRRGSPSSSGASSTRRSCGTTRTSSRTRFKPEYADLAFPNDRERVRRVVRGPHRLSDRRRGDAPAQRDRLHAQPPAHDRGVVPRQGPARRLALGRALLRRHAPRLRPRLEQRRLAMGGVDRLRRAAVLPHLQSGDAVGALRPRRQVHPPLRAGARARSTPTRSTRRGRCRPPSSARRAS